MDEQLIELETRIAFQDESIQQLSDVVYRQQQQIDFLEKQVQMLRGQFQNLAHSLPSKPQDDRPPHY